MIELTALRVFLSSIFGFWSRLPPTIKILIFLIAALCAGFIWGRHETTKKYEARIEKSIQEAKRVDKEANDVAFKNMLDEKTKWQKQALDAENKLSQYAVEYSQMKERCPNDETFTKRNNDIDNLLFNNGVPGVSSKKRFAPR